MSLVAERPGFERPRVLLGIAGGSGSGKSFLARHVAEAFAGKTAVICHDWYYRDNGGLGHEEVAKLNFDHPRALETSLLCRQLDELMDGRPIEAPSYDYQRHARLPRRQRVEPRPLVIVDGLFTLHDRSLRERLTVSVFIETPADLRLLRRVRRDVNERRVDVEETLRLYESYVRPMHERFVQPSSHHATWIWSQGADKSFPKLLVRDLARRLELAPA